ncbi:MAG: mechanosensitive ion channel family protein [Candidatus Levyibacteriota bacterium]
MPNVANTLVQSLNQGLFTAASFIPNLISGLIIFLIGILLASLVKRLLIDLLNALKIEQYLKKYDIPEAKKEFSWTNILAEIARWFVIILFLIPTADVWGLPQVTTVLNTFLLYLPNVFVAAIIGLIGMALAKLASELVRASTRNFSQDVSRALATTVRIAITIFVLLAVLNQLGVAQDLIRILFTGFVAMIALAGGIAFGLGGKDFAHTLLDKLQKKLK